MRTSTAAALLATGVIATAACGTARPAATVAPGGATGGTAAAPSAAAQESLARTDWWLVEYTLNGTTVRVAGRHALHFDGKGAYYSHACNHTRGPVVIAPGHLTFPPGKSMSTEMHCSGVEGEVEKAAAAVLVDRAAWTKEGASLRLTGAKGDTLRYEPMSAGKPADGEHVVVEGERGGAQYRVVTTSRDGQLQSLTVERRDGPGTPWGGGSHGAPSGGEPAMYSLGLVEVGGDVLLASFVPPGAVRVTHAAERGAEEVELATHDVPDSPWRVFAGFVDAHSSRSVVTAYAADGSVVEPRWQK